ncbi:G2/mitotic-specific cyclin S13-7 [Ziziphus jujuba]|uniref:B-like cyclin n=1 Tax=Ziziphus jujuba TaxID=326968 RepID=A0ABM3I9X6_ZIZJJ|nr:G2/mitotic-specific cyclin S13-7 [Ziziphus jujuba]
MDARVVVPQQDRGGKLKNEAAQQRNRRVLGDIGNVEAVQVVEGKPHAHISRPITRRYHAQLLAKAKAASENNENLVAQGFEDKVAVNKKFPAKAQKKAVGKRIPEDVVVISDDNEVENAKTTNPRERSSRREVKTLTSILTARSKAASELSIKPKGLIVDVDAADVDDELAVVEYLDDLYKFYKLTEDESRVHDYMGSQKDVNSKMRSILIDWLMDVHKRFELMPETIYLTVNIIDRYLSMKNISRKELQLVGISSMIIACKYEEVWVPQVNDFICLSDYAYTGNQILVMEKEILQKLEWYLTVPTPYVFLVRYIKASVSPDQEMENLVFFLAELGIMQYPTVILYSPSMLAAAAVYAARCTLNKIPFWSETLKHHTGYSEEQLRDCSKLLVQFHLNAAGSNLQAVYRKFSRPDRGAVAYLTPAKNLLAQCSSN